MTFTFYKYKYSLLIVYCISYMPIIMTIHSLSSTLYSALPGNGTCAACHPSCRACSGGAMAGNCTRCRAGWELRGGACVAGGGGLAAVFQHVTLGVGLAAVAGVLVLLLAAGVALLYRSRAGQTSAKYGPVPREDTDCQVRLTYSDDLDD